MATVLVIEDRSLDREFLVELLTNAGHRLLESTDGAEALILIQSEKLDLIITDIITPSMDSLEFVQRLHLNPKFTSIPIVFYTASYQSSEAKVIAEACGVKHVITKPAENDVILNTVNAALATKILPTQQPSFDLETSNTFGLIAKKLSQKADELETSSLRLGALIEIGLEFAEQRNPIDLLTLTCMSARKMISSKCAAVGITNGEEEPHYFIVKGTGADENEITAPSFNKGLLKQSLMIQKPQRLKHLQEDPQKLGLPNKIHSIRDFLSVPVTSGLKQYGLLYLVNKIGASEFSEYDERMAATLAAQLAVAYENLQLYNELNLRALKLQDEIEIRKRFEKSLAKREEQYRLLTEYSPNAIFIQCEDKIVYANTVTYKLLGATKPEELIGKSRYDLMHPDYIDIVKQRVADVREGKPVPLIIEKFIRLDGIVIDVEITSSPCEFEGKPAMQVAMHDITEYKRTERYLAVQYSISNELIKTKNKDQVLQKTLKNICLNLEWDIGQFWEIDKKNKRLNCINIWPLKKKVLEDFRKISHTLTYKPGVGLPGRVFKDKKPLWIEDVTKDPQFLRTPWPEKCGLKTGFAFPIFYQNEILGVIEFFTHEKRRMDSGFVNIFYAIGSQIGYMLMNTKS